MNEEKLIQEAQQGNVSAMPELAEYYAQKSKGNGIDDKVGDVMSVEDFFRSLNSEAEVNVDFQKKAYKYYRLTAEA